MREFGKTHQGNDRAQHEHFSKAPGPDPGNQANDEILAIGALPAPQWNQYIQQGYDLQQWGDHDGQEHQQREHPVVLVVKPEGCADQGGLARAAIDVHRDQRKKIAQPQQHQCTNAQRDRDIHAAVHCMLQGFAATHATNSSGCRSRGASMGQITGGAEHHHRHCVIVPQCRALRQIGYV